MHKCPMWWAVVVLVIGIFYLGQDLGWWSFWTVSWWTLAFLLVGIKHLSYTGNKKKK